MMKVVKLIAAATLVAAMPSSALAARSDGASIERCYFDFQLPWQGYMFIPCIAGIFR